MDKRNIRCPYCDDELETLLAYTVGWSEHRDHVGFECENYLCSAVWDNRGNLVTGPKPQTAVGNEKGQG